MVLANRYYGVIANLNGVVLSFECYVNDGT